MAGSLEEALGVHYKFIIDNDLRTISIPNDMVFGVYNDRNVQTINFEMPRYYHGDLDLSEFSIRINYITGGHGNIYLVLDKVATANKITFTWTVDIGAYLQNGGSVTFAVCLRKVDQNSQVTHEFNTTIHTVKVLEGLEVSPASQHQVLDYLTQIQQIIENLEDSAEQMAEDIAEQVRQSIPEDYSELTEEVSDLNQAISDIKQQSLSYALGIVDDFVWHTDGYYELSTGDYIVNNTYKSTYKIAGIDFTTAFNFGDLTNKDFISLWDDDIYVGYYYRGQYKSPTGETINKPDYNNWAIALQSTSTGVYHLISLANVKLEVAELDERTIDLKSEFDWSVGYYRYTNGTIVTSGYHHTQKVSGDHYAFADATVFNANTRNFLSFWLNGTYVGYYLDGKYYDPSSTEVEGITYDQWAVNIYTDDYEDLKPLTLQLRVTRLETESSSRYAHLYGMKIGFLGDSITEGVGATESAKSYVSLMANEFGSTNVLNYGIGGSLISTSTSHPTVPARGMCERYTDMSDNLDIVVVYGGTNDWYYGTGWGTVDSVDKSTFLGALNVLMSGLVQKYCGKEIFFVTPMSSAYSGYNTDNPNPNTNKTMLDYRNAIIERATYHGIGVIDLYSMCGMDVAHNEANKTYYSADGVHPNDAGHKRVHDRIVTYISNILY